MSYVCDNQTLALQLVQVERSVCMLGVACCAFGVFLSFAFGQGLVSYVVLRLLHKLLLVLS
jgi:hypothetical protein